MPELLEQPAAEAGPVTEISFELNPTQFAAAECEARHVWLEGPAGEGKTFWQVVSMYRHYQRMLLHFQLGVWEPTIENLTGGLQILQQLRKQVTAGDKEAYRAVLHEWWAEHEGDLPPKIAAGHFGRPLKAALIRDTHVNIKTNFIPSVQRGFTGQFGFHDSLHRMLETGCALQALNEWYAKPEGPPPSWLDLYLFGMDDMASLDRIQGGEYDLIGVEEPAPILSTGNNGIREEVFLVCAARMRGGNLPKRLQVTMNPADEEHWTSRQQDDPLPDTRVFRIKAGENKHITEADRQAVKDAYKGRADLYARFVKGERAKVYAGVAITPEFKEELHLSKEWLLPDWRFGTVYRFWDGGLNPTCVFMQITPSGRLHFLDCVMAPGFGMDQLIETRVIPVMNRPRYQRIRKWEDIGDPALNTREQSNSEHRAALVIEEKLKTTFQNGVSDWESRRTALKYIFTQAPGGLPMVVVNCRTTEGEPFNRLKNAFAGGYSYKVNALGQVLRDGPDKNIHSHPGDAVSHAVARLFIRPQEKTTDPRAREKRNQIQQRRAKGYGVGAQVGQQP